MPELDSNSDPRRNLPLRIIKGLIQGPTIKADSESALADWWKKFNKYPLYCIILATEADESVALLIEKHRQELAEIAGDKCSIIYFRNFEKAKLLQPFHFADHSKAVMQFIKIIGVQPSKLPCLLFFGQVISSEYVEYVSVPLGGKTVSELMKLFRELFAFIYSRNEVSLSAVQAFNSSERIKITEQTIRKNLAQLSREMLIASRELFVALIKSLTNWP
jgi:hypothetical protein